MPHDVASSPRSPQHSAPRSPLTPAEWADYFDLRWRILRAPWDQPRGSERDEAEETSEHLMIADPDYRPLAVGRLHFNSSAEAQVRYMAVEPSARGQGLGGRILEEFERRARAAGAASIILNAREDAQRFYQNHGFKTIGPAPTIFDAVKHVRMRKDLI
ncbi:MAG: GNAT family N-acetyltransferase [Verrucomicrobiota bacterium]|nr:GNAT family N-acetyltransferase [Verrucomicrobiota bacterium]